MLLIGRMPRHNARVHGSRLALCDDVRSLTWREVDAEVDRIARTLMAAGLSVGSRAAVMARNSVDLVLTNFALARIGAVMVPLNYWLRERELGELLRDVEPALLIVDAVYEERIASVCAGIGSTCPRLRLRGAATGRGAAPSLMELAAGRPADPVESEIDERAPYMILFTSGTTSGRTKGAVRSHRVAYLNAMTAALELALVEDDRIIVYTPNFHAGFWDSQLLMVLLRAGAARIVDGFAAPQVRALIGEFRATVVFGIATTMQALVRSAGPGPVDSVRVVVLPARVTPEFLAEVARYFGVPLREVRSLWGMTEVGPYALLLRGDEWIDRPGATGRDTLLVETRIVDDDRQEVGPDVVGEIAIRGDLVMNGYFRAPQETIEAVVDGWFLTGDLASRDSSGVVHFFDRRKDVIKRGGENISAQEVEAYLMRHPAVAEVAVIGVPDDHWEQTPMAVVVATEGNTVDEQDLIRHCREGLAGFKVPQYVRLVPELPKVSLGKVVKRELVERFAPGRPAPAEPDASTPGDRRV